MKINRFIFLIALFFCNHFLFAQEIYFQNFSINDTIISEKYWSKNAEISIEGRILNIQIINLLKDTAKYEYQFEGIDEKWKTYQSQINLYFQEIPGGKYAFNVRQKNNPTSQLTIYVNVKPLLWQKWWFLPSIFLILLLIIGSALYFVFLYKLRQEMQMRQVRNNIASDLHDEIGATLSGIGILSTIAKNQLEANHPSHALIGRITDDALNIGNTMDDIVWSINPQNDDLEKIIARMSRYAAELFDAKEIDYQIVIPENLKEVKLTMEQRRDVYLIFKEAVNNLVKYAKCQHAHVEIKVHNQQFELKISDNGKGFDPNKESQRNGLKNMKARAINLGGTLKIDSEIDKGSTVILTFLI
jgi:signal transduction histidine kinase